MGFKPYIPEFLKSLHDNTPNPGPNCGHTGQSQEKAQSSQNRPKAQRNNSPDAFEILGLPRTAKKGDVVRAYRDKMKLNHPDLTANLDQEIQAFASEWAKQINTAYEEILQKMG